MKKLVSLILCVLIMGSFLVSCNQNTKKEAEKNLADLLEKYPVEEKQDVELDFYVVMGDETTPDALSTVTDRINYYLKQKFKTTLDMHYYTESEYVNSVLSAADPSKIESERADIVLLINYDMFDELYKKDALANLNEFLTADYSFGTLNTQVANALMNSVKIDEYWINDRNAANQTISTYNKQSVYCIPNNHVVGEYQLVLINEEAAKAVYFGNTDRIAEILDRDSEQAIAFVERLETSGYLEENGLTVDDCLKFASGSYADIVEYKESGYYVNVSAKPVATIEEAFSSAFAVVRHPNDPRSSRDETLEISVQQKKSYTDHYIRCMEVIYELNTSVELRNYLQYGVTPGNYDLDRDEAGNGYVTPTESNRYVMNLLHTGDIFTAYYSEAHGWNAELAGYGELQNKEAVAAPKFELNGSYVCEVDEYEMYYDERYILKADGVYFEYKEYQLDENGDVMYDADGEPIKKEQSVYLALAYTYQIFGNIANVAISGDMNGISGTVGLDIYGFEYNGDTVTITRPVEGGDPQVLVFELSEQ